MISKIEFDPDLSVKFHKWIIHNIRADFMRSDTSDDECLYNVGNLIEKVESKTNQFRSDIDQLELYLISGIEWIALTELVDY